MSSVDLVERAEATERISINNEDALVYHARNPNIDQQEFAERIHKQMTEHEFEDLDSTDKSLLENASDLMHRVNKLTQTGFTMVFHDTDDLSLELEMAISDSFKYFSYDPEEWDNASYTESEPTDAEVVAVYQSLVNAAWCVNTLQKYTEEIEDKDTETLFSEGRFNSFVTQGLMTAFRDAFVTHSPNSPIQAMFFHDRELAIIEAIDNALGIELSETHLHGLMLADWNQSVNLQSASQYGKQKSVNEGMNAIENLTTAMEAEDEESD